MNGHAPSSYVSSDNDSELEDADMRKELHKLREKHMKEISELQAFQRSEIERLYREVGKRPPPNAGLPHAAPPCGRRRKAAKHKVKAGKLLNPVVRQLKSHLGADAAQRKGESSGSSSGSPAKSWAPSERSGGQRGASPERVHTCQPRSFKGSFSSDHIHAGQRADGTANLTSRGWTVYHQTSERVAFQPSGKPRARFLSRPVTVSIWSSFRANAAATAAPSPPSPRLQTNNGNNKKRRFREDLRQLADDRAKEAAAHRRPPSFNQIKQQRRPNSAGTS
ncbi:serine/threonine-protein kinase WNK2-like isoform X2 [Hippocampus zosterae]|uniref:serine/threonine-protein kinase WNK2-like isoform X2 n=1 Tax=Hippocampus zosterae TaxID=109293 RepID=UPI00223E672B|nr:serine/threonine-protein kinase WNK2-like isoform X2 [Hippocampus zosterae]